MTDIESYIENRIRHSEPDLYDYIESLRTQLAALQQRCREQEEEIERLSDLSRFLAKTWAQIDTFVYEHCLALDQYPVIQGTSNQFNLMAIGQQPYHKENVALAVELLLPQPPTTGGEDA